jgi:hypothetical protein
MGQPLRVAHHLDGRRVQEFFKAVDRVRCSGNRRRGVIGQRLCHPPHDGRVDQRLVALHIDDDFVVTPAQGIDDFAEAIRAGRMIRTGQQHIPARRFDGITHTFMIGRNPDFGGPRRQGPFHDPHHHGLAGYVRQRLGGQAGRRETRRHDGLEAQVHQGAPASSALNCRASSASMTGMPSLMA